MADYSPMNFKRNTLEEIRKNCEHLPRIQNRIARYILENPEQVVRCSISDLAHFSGAKSEASIVHFYRSLGFDGYKDFKLCIAQELAGSTLYHSYEDVKMGDSVKDIKRKVFSSSALTLNANADIADEASYEAAVEMILSANRVILLGYAASAAVCYYALFRFLEMGINCHFSPDSHINAALLTQLNPGDVVFCVSFSGETRDIVFPLKDAVGNIKVISLTNSPNSSLAKLSDAVILSHTNETNLVVDAMNARISQMCTIDTLFTMGCVSQGSEAYTRLMRTRRTFYDYKK